MRRGRASILGALLLLLGGCGAAASPPPASEGPPKRIVSMNPCIDAILHAVADPARIAGVSHYSQDPSATSVPIGWARRFPGVADAAEDIVALRPDLVIAGPHVDRATAMALDRLGIPVMRVGVPATVAESRAQVEEIARRIGRPAAGRMLSARMAQATAVDPADPVTALIRLDSGLVPGRGTLADDLMTASGFRNIAPDLGLAQWDLLPIEDLLLQPPSVLLTAEASMATGAETGARAKLHPALRRLAATTSVAPFPARLLHCGGPAVIEASARLRDIRRRMGGA